MAANKGNQYWQDRKRHGRKKNIKTPQELWDLACDYFQWCIDNPLHEVKPFVSQNEVTMVSIPKMRAMTWNGLDGYICDEGVLVRLQDYKANLNGQYKDFSYIIERIGNVIYEQKFTGAATNLLNANIIARELGLRDAQVINSNISGELKTSIGLDQKTIDSLVAKL